MYGPSDAFQEGLRRFLTEGGYAWVERPGPPPPGVKILKNAHPPRLAERLCEEGFPLVYIVAVRRRDFAALEEACLRGEAVCYVYGDVEWAPELENRCRPVTFYVDIKEERRALEALLLYIARTRSLPWIAFNRDVLRIAGICDAEPNACVTEDAVMKKIEAMKKQVAAQRPQPQSSAGGGAGPADTAETQSGAPPTPAQDAGRAVGKPPRLDPAVLELLRWCCGEECVTRLLSCHE